MAMFRTSGVTLYRIYAILCVLFVLCCNVVVYSGTGLERRSRHATGAATNTGETFTVTVFENGDCILPCKLQWSTLPSRLRRSRNVVWLKDDVPIPMDDNNKKYSIVTHLEYWINLKVRKVSLKESGGVYQCLIIDKGAVTNNTNKNYSAQPVMLNVLEAPKNEYPICSGKPMNTHSKTFSLSCCAEKVAESGIKLEWKYSSGTRIPDHRAKTATGGSGQFCIHHNLTSVHNGASYTCHLSSVGAVQGLNRSCKIQYQKPEVRLEKMDSQQAKFRCSAMGADTYKWSLGDDTNSKSIDHYKQDDGSAVTSVMILNLNSVHNGTFITCTATGVESMGSDGIMLIMGRPSAKEQSMTLILGLVMGTVAGLLAVILVIYLVKMNALQKCCCGENDFSSLEFRTTIRMRGSQNPGNGQSSYYVVQSTNAGNSSMHPLMAERDSSNSRLSTSGYQSDNDSLHAAGAVGGAAGGPGFAGNYYELRKAPRPGGPILRGATCRDYYNDPCPGPRTPPRPPKPGLTDPRRLNVEGLDYADLDLVDVAEEEEDIPTKLPEEQTEYADILRIPSLRHSSIS